jgi:hypothetical protein
VSDHNVGGRQGQTHAEPEHLPSSAARLGSRSPHIGSGQRRTDLAGPRRETGSEVATAAQERQKVAAQAAVGEMLRRGINKVA